MKKILCVALLATSVQGYADERLYVFGGLGAASYGFEQSDADELAAGLMDVGFSSASAKIDNGAALVKIGMGYELSPVVAIEGAYTYLGPADLTINTTGPTMKVTGEIETSGFELAVKASAQVSEKINVFARAGLYAWESDLTLKVSGLSSATETFADGTDFTLGAGIAFNNFRVEYQRYNLDEMEVDTFSVSYQHHF